MTDIVERLRELARNYADGVAGMVPQDHFAWEAAAEIEQLCSARDLLIKALMRATDADETAVRDAPMTEAVKAAAEIERLRAALLTVPCPGGGYTGMPANTEPTVAACMAAGVCGCIYGDALKDAAH